LRRINESGDRTAKVQAGEPSLWPLDKCSDFDEAALAVIFRHPELPEDFIKVGAMRADTPAAAIPAIAKPYEGGKVLHFPNLKFDIDHAFWAGLPSEGYPGLKKLSSSPAAKDPGKDPLLDKRLPEVGLPPNLERRLRAEILRFYERVLPVYEALFAGYRFTRRQVVWRLNTIRNENLHVDTYAAPFPDHFARLFVNLDEQPRIWMTGWSIDALYERFGGQIPREMLERASANELHTAVNTAAFGGRSAIWWDGQPRHVAYFDPGDVWAVDSRQLSHQIFYGRRAVSIDFFVDPASMTKPKRHYLALADRFRRTALSNSGTASN
jgi:hypothetical protein